MVPLLLDQQKIGIAIEKFIWLNLSFGRKKKRKIKYPLPDGSLKFIIQTTT